MEGRWILLLSAPCATGVDTFTAASVRSSGWICRDCEFHIPRGSGSAERWLPPPPDTIDEALVVVRGELSLLLHEPVPLSASERRQSLAKAYYFIKFVPSSWE